MLKRAGIWPMTVTRCFSIASRESFGSKMWRITATPPPKRIVPSCSVVQPTWEGGRLISIRSEVSSSKPDAQADVLDQDVLVAQKRRLRGAGGAGREDDQAGVPLSDLAAGLLHPARKQAEEITPS